MGERREKLIVFIFGLFVALFLLEISLQAYGFYYRAQKDYYHKHALHRADGKFVILCLGNCFTFGTGATKEDSYPARLQKLCSQDYKNILVVNKGKPGQNSIELLAELEKNIALYNPSLIILQTGSPDMRNLNNYGLYLKREGYFKEDKNPLACLRIYRLSVILANIFQNRARQMALTKRRHREEPKKQEITLASIKTKIMGTLRLWYHELKYSRRQLPSLAILLQKMEDYPYSVHTPLPEKIEDVWRWAESDIREIVKISKAKGVTVVLQSYPILLEKEETFRNEKRSFLYGWKDAKNMQVMRDIFSKVAKEENVIFVDNSDLFQKNAEAASKDNYHPNAKGYEIIAQRLYERISKENLLTVK